VTGERHLARLEEIRFTRMRITDSRLSVGGVLAAFLHEERQLGLSICDTFVLEFFVGKAPHALPIDYIDADSTC